MAKKLKSAELAKGFHDHLTRLGKKLSFGTVATGTGGMMTGTALLIDGEEFDLDEMVKEWSKDDTLTRTMIKLVKDELINRASK